MLWEIEIRPKGADGERVRVAEEYDLLTHGKAGSALVTGAARGWLLEGPLSREQAERLTRDLLVDSLAETGALGALNERPADGRLATVLYKPGVMDPAALSVVDAGRDLGVTVDSVRSFRRYYGPPLSPEAKAVLFRKVLANEAVEQVVEGPLTLEHLTRRRPVPFPPRHRAAARPGRRRPEEAQPRRPVVAEPRRNADHPGTLSRLPAANRPTWSWKRWRRPGRSTARTRRSRAASSSATKTEFAATTTS